MKQTLTKALALALAVPFGAVYVALHLAASFYQQLYLDPTDPEAVR